MIGRMLSSCAAVGALLLALHFPHGRHDLALGLGELFLGDLSELEPHLRLEEHLPEGRIVLRFVFSGLDDFVEDEAEAADQEGV